MFGIIAAIMVPIAILAWGLLSPESFSSAISAPFSLFDPKPFSYTASVINKNYHTQSTDKIVGVKSRGRNIKTQNVLLSEIFIELDTGEKKTLLIENDSKYEQIQVGKTYEFEGRGSEISKFVEINK